MNAQWVEKYRPKELKQIIGCQDQISKVIEWFKKFNRRDVQLEKKALLFSGNPGTSKTTVAHVAFREFGYQIKEFNASDIRSKKLVESQLNKLVSSKQVDEKYNVNFRPIGIIMDEVDGMSSGDKGGMIELIKLINPTRGKRSINKQDKQNARDRWIPPIICICNNGSEKKISDLKKDCYEIEFTQPSIDDLIAVVNHVCVAEDIRMSEDAKILVSEFSQGDYRRVMFLLQHIAHQKKDDEREFTSEDVYSCLEVFQKKNIDLNTYEMTNRILNYDNTAEDILKLYESDKSLLPMMVHENYLSIINSLNTNGINRLKLAKNTIDSIIQGDIIDKIMYNVQGWHLQSIHGIESCYMPSYNLSTYPRVSRPKIKFTTTLGKYSLTKSNLKNINQKILPLINNGRSYKIEDIQLLGELVLKLILEKDQEQGVAMLKKYNLVIDDIEKLIKMNKLENHYRLMYKNKQKTHLRKIYGDLKRSRPVSFKNLNRSQSSRENLSSLNKIEEPIKEDSEDEENLTDGSDSSSPLPSPVNVAPKAKRSGGPKVKKLKIRLKQTSN